MSAEQHDSLCNSSSALTRRAAITGTLVAGLLGANRVALAQEATPVSDDVSTLYVQACESGNANPVGDAGGTYELTLAHASGQTLFFADRPERITGIVSTPAFLEEVVAVADDPPNAAMVFSSPDAGDEVEVAVVELTAPSADREARAITYRVRIIDVAQEDQRGDAGTGSIVPVDELPASFGQATLFIDGLAPPPDNGGITIINRTYRPIRIRVTRESTGW